MIRTILIIALLASGLGGCSLYGAGKKLESMGYEHPDTGEWTWNHTVDPECADTMMDIAVKGSIEDLEAVDKEWARKHGNREPTMSEGMRFLKPMVVDMLVLSADLIDTHCRRGS